MGKFLKLMGAVLMAAAVALSGYNLWDEAKAEEQSAAAAEALSANIVAAQSEQLAVGESVAAEEKEWIPDYVLDPEMKMPVTEVEGMRCVGLLEIPVLDLQLPVMETWSYPSLKKAPCRYSGSAYLENLVIAAHNYKSHFGTLPQLKSGDAVTFTDADGNRFFYQVAVLEILPPGAVEEMMAGEFPLSLFTCTYGGQSRVTVRCEKA